MASADASGIGSLIAKTLGTETMHIGGIRSWLSWLRQGVAFWIGLLGLIVAISIAAWLRTEPTIRWTGLALQVLGTIVLVTGIHKALRQQGQLGLWGALAAYMRAIPIGTRTVTADLVVSYGIAGGGFTSVKHFIPPTDLTPEAFAEALKKNIEIVHQSLADAFLEIQNARSNTHGLLHAESMAREAAFEALKAESAKATNINSAITLFGTTWLLVGSVLSTLPQELANLFNRLFV